MAGTEPTAVCPLHAESGEVPFWRDREPATGNDQQSTDVLEAQPSTPAQQQRREKERDRGIKRLLRIIFGDGH